MMQTKEDLLAWYSTLEEGERQTYVNATDVSTWYLLIDGTWQNRKNSWCLFEKNNQWKFAVTDAVEGQIICQLSFFSERVAVEFIRDFLKR